MFDSRLTSRTHLSACFARIAFLTSVAFAELNRSTRNSVSLDQAGASSAPGLDVNRFSQQCCDASRVACIPPLMALYGEAA